MDAYTITAVVLHNIKAEISRDMNGAHRTSEFDVRHKLPAKKPAKPEDLGEVLVELFRTHLKRGPWPTASQCEYLVNDIEVVRTAKPAKALIEDPEFRRRRATIAAMEKLIRERMEHDPVPGLRLPAQVEAEVTLPALQKALDQAKSSLMGWVDPWAGERRGAAWHKPARFIARQVKATVIKAGRKKASFDKHSPLVPVVIEALVLAGQKERTPEAVAAALADFPL
jgi:hypothetical protein